jgi:hypothetical protein
VYLLSLPTHFERRIILSTIGPKRQSSFSSYISTAPGVSRQRRAERGEASRENVFPMQEGSHTEEALGRARGRDGTNCFKAQLGGEGSTSAIPSLGEGRTVTGQNVHVSPLSGPILQKPPVRLRPHSGPSRLSFDNTKLLVGLLVARIRLENTRPLSRFLVPDEVVGHCRRLS